MNDSTSHPFCNSIQVTFPEIVEYCHSFGIECDRLDIHMIEENLPIAENYCGILLADATYYGVEDKVSILKKTNLPIVVYAGFECSAKDLQFAAVVTDRKQAYLDGLEHLLRHGHRKICFLLSNDWEIFGMRTGLTQKDLIQYLKARGIGRKEVSFILLHEWQQNRSLSENNSDQIRSILSRPDRPTAFYCYTDYIAFQVKQILNSMRLHVPEDVALMGFSGFLHGSLVNQELSTVDFRYDRIAKLAVDLLLAHKRWKDASPPVIYHAPYEIVSRKSTDRCLIFEWEQESLTTLNTTIKRNKKKEKRK